MNEQELKQLWQSQSVPESGPIPQNETVERMKIKTRRFGRTIFWRDARELVACVVISAWAGYGLFHKHSAITHLGDVVLILGCFYIAAKLLTANRLQRAYLNPASVKEFIGGELVKVNQQIRLLQTILWWYLLPIYCGASLVVIGADKGILVDGIDLIVFALTFGFIYWLNQYAVRKSLLPLKAELEQTLKSVPEFSQPNNPDHTDAFNL
jgi:hypothetical protein